MTSESPWYLRSQLLLNSTNTIYVVEDNAIHGLIIGIVIKMRSYQDKAQRGTASFNFFPLFRFGIMTVVVVAVVGGGYDDGGRDGEIFGFSRVAMQLFFAFFFLFFFFFRQSYNRC